MKTAKRKRTEEDEKYNIRFFMGVRQICAYMQIGPSTFYDWQKNHKFPAARTPDGRWMTDTQVITEWLRERLGDGMGP